ncbi:MULTISPECIES: Rieske 2Fe-2S domain-containing protein [unclassified Pseudomonas]|uniref:Rieske (2Fe-2S) protein n=1 Tax=unclassified Pseudomonas TaxID=196821 RepID=UPI00128F0E2C|nr:Rieske 2Fe-2S domain-containing protein [Pseudomonas sp. MN1F]MQG94811.1 Rieske 2Fe-2S domain-containing protein [Pseudomonas sp. MN1F]
MSRRIALAASQVPERNGRVLVESHGKSLAVFNVADTLYAIDDSCPHQGASLCGGRLEGRVIQCCAHGLRFDLASGYLLNSTALKVNSYPVECQGQQVFIVLNDEEGGQ